MLLTRHITHCYDELANVHASYARAVIGHSVMGLEIAEYRVDDSHLRGAPKVLIVGNIHGNEVSGFDLVARVLREPPHTILLGIDVRWVPSMNPDGMYYDMRENVDRVDLNRAFPDICNRTNGSATIESRAMMDYIATERPLAIVSYHGGAAEVVWGPDQNCTSDALSVATAVSDFQLKLMQSAATAYARTLRVPIIEGSVMYQISGSMLEYAVPRFSQLGLVVEMDEAKEPTDKRENLVVSRHTTALFDLLRDIKTHAVRASALAAKFPAEHFADNNGYILYYP
jgi:succinylglutamate desuccinylase